MSRLLLVPVVSGLFACGSWIGIDADARGEHALECIESPAYELFDAALCVCEDLNEVGALAIAAATDLPLVGVNGAVRLVALSEIEGSMAVEGSIDTVANLVVADELRTGGDLDWVGAVDVGSDLHVGGDIVGTGNLRVGGSLHLNGDNNTVGQQEIHGVGGYVAPAGRPCACDAPFDVAGAVANASMADDVVHLDAIASVGLTELELFTGRYFTTAIETVGLTRVVVTGAVAWFIDGDVDTVGAIDIELADDATLDLYVSGNISSVGRTHMARDVLPGSFRLYVGGTEPVTVDTVGSTRSAVAIYAPTAELHYVGSMRIEGAVFVRSLHGVGRFELDYGHPGTSENEECGEPAPDEEPM